MTTHAERNRCAVLRNSVAKDLDEGWQACERLDGASGLQMVCGAALQPAAAARQRAVPHPIFHMETPDITSFT